MLLPCFCCSELLQQCPNLVSMHCITAAFFQLSVPVPYSESAKPFVNTGTSLTAFCNEAISASLSRETIIILISSSHWDFSSQLLSNEPSALCVQALLSTNDQTSRFKLDLRLFECVKRCHVYVMDRDK